MKKWDCVPCGYVHKGDSPPEECPVCMAPRNMFEEQSTEDACATEQVPDAAPPARGCGCGGSCR